MCSRTDTELRARTEIAAERIDKALAALLPLSRTRIQRAIETGRVTVDGVTVQRASEPVAAGREIVVELEPKAEPTLEPADIPLRVLWEDGACLVIDKPAGLVVHPGAGHPDRTLVNALLHHRPAVAGVGDERKAGLVHRLDKDTSGCLLVAKTDAAHGSLSGQFAARTVEKAYWAFAWGHLGSREGVFDAPIGRSTRDRQRMSSHTRRGRRALTRWRVVERYAVAEWLEIELETGRTHQIRVHLAEGGHPVMGDARYGGGPSRARGFHGPPQGWAREAAAAATRQALHARTLAFDHPTTGERVRVAAPLPADLEALRAVLRRHPA
ncbi:MAG TPA: RluA family pseudouridine synthase [Gemmatimonadota bacterium]|nr:RluA family pseudouridine synthase [Gemmatimonadota bacterium]